MLSPVSPSQSSNLEVILQPTTQQQILSEFDNRIYTESLKTHFFKS